MSLRFEHGFLTLALLAQAAPALADDGFSVRNYEISGAHVDADITRPFTGERISIDEIQRAARAVEQRLGRGWKVIIIPDQDVTDGTVRLQAILAGHPSILSIQDPAEIGAYFSALSIGTPFEATRARAQATLYRELTGEFARVDINPEASGVALTLQADQLMQKKPLRFSMGLDNTGSIETGWNRLTLTATHINLWNRHHVGSIAAVLSTAQPQDVRVLVGSYRLPIFSQDTAVDFYAADSRAAVGNVSELAIRGKGTILGMRVTRYQAFDSIAGTHQFSAGIEQRKLDSEVSFNGEVLDITPNYAMRPLTLAYIYTQAGRFASSVSLSHGLGGNNAEDETYELVRFGAKSRYNILRASAEMLWPLFNGITGRLAANGQYTNDALVPGEQFGLGGASTVRGFPEREISNDRGYRISAELSKQIAGEHRLIAFLDRGRTSRNAEQPGDPGTQTLMSIGVGTRFGERNRWSGSLDFAHVLQGTQITPSGSYRIHFQFAVFF
jgi:hemolysin activation/secretion protein